MISTVQYLDAPPFADTAIVEGGAIALPRFVFLSGKSLVVYWSLFGW